MLRHRDAGNWDVAAFLAFFRFLRHLLCIQLARLKQHTPSLEPPQKQHGSYPQDPGHAGDREPEAACSTKLVC
jgi:hypothetical protein